MTAVPEPASIAIVDSPEIHRCGVHARLERMGHLLAPFPDASQLMSALAGGQRFDLVLLSPCDEKTAWARLSAVCGVLCMPALLIVHGPWTALQALEEEDPKSSFIDLAHADVTDSELDWRIRALLQRAGASAQQLSKGIDIVLGDYQLFGRQRVVLHRGREIHLQPRQYELASELFRNVGRVVTRGWLWASLWGRASPQEGARALDVCVANVRRKLDLCRENGFMLRAAYKHGYLLYPVEPLKVAATGASEIIGGRPMTAPLG